MIDLRLLALHLHPVANLTPDTMNLDNSVLQRVLERVDAITSETVNGSKCAVVKRVDEGGGELSVFIDDGMRYRGCRFIQGDDTVLCWVDTVEEYDGVSFPVAVDLKIKHADLVSLEEYVVLTNLSLNQDVPDETFEFSGLGVAPGDHVFVVNTDPGSITDAYWDGRRLVDSQLDAVGKSRVTGWRTLIGSLIATIASVWILRVLIRKRA